MTVEETIASTALRWWIRTAVIIHSCLAVLTLIPSVLVGYTLCMYFLVYQVQTPPGYELLNLFEPLLHLFVHIVSLTLFIRAYQQARSPASSIGTRRARKAAIYTAIAEMVLVVLLLVTVVWSNLSRHPLLTEFRSNLMYSVVALSNEIVQFIAFAGYFLLMIVPSLIVLWILKRRGEAMMVVLKVGLIVGAVTVIASLCFWVVFLTLWAQNGVAPI
jgi:hypothetical protein